MRWEILRNNSYHSEFWRRRAQGKLKIFNKMREKQADFLLIYIYMIEFTEYIRNPIFVNRMLGNRRIQYIGVCP